MSTRVTAVYENGILRPIVPLLLAEGQTVQVLLEDRALTSAQPSEEESLRRVDSARNLVELFSAMNEAPEDEQYDLLESLNENRRRSGVPRLLFPPIEKGAT